MIVGPLIGRLPHKVQDKLVERVVRRNAGPRR
jgi:hypothetical protein